MLRLQASPDAPRFLIDDMVEDVLERFAFLRHEPKRALVIGDYSGRLAPAISQAGGTVTELEPAHGFDEEIPYPVNGFDTVVSLGTLDTVNDLPGALIHIRQALAPGGMMIASFVSSGSLPALRAAMLESDGDRPAPRIHPLVDVRAGGQLLQRAGFANPVIDHRPVDVRYRSFDRLLADLRAMGLTNVLSDPGPALNRRSLHHAKALFEGAGEGTLERFEILTLTGWR